MWKSGVNWSVDDWYFIFTRVRFNIEENLTDSQFENYSIIKHKSVRHYLKNNEL